MPFFDDSGVRREEHRGPVWTAFVVFAEQVERMVAVALAWSLTLLPMVVAIAFPGLHPVVRALLAAATVVALAPGTMMVHGLAELALRGEEVSVASGREQLARLALPSLRALTPLYALVGVVAGVAWWAQTAGLTAVEVLARLGVLLALVGATTWCPLLLRQPDASAPELLRDSAELLWRRPGALLRTSLAVLVVTAIGTVTVAGLALAAPVLVALLQVTALEHIAHDNTHDRAERRQVPELEEGRA